MIQLDKPNKQLVTDALRRNTVEMDIFTFPRDENGKLDFKDGTYKEVHLSLLKCKYTEEVVRLCFGTGIILPTPDSSVWEGK